MSIKKGKKAVKEYLIKHAPVLYSRIRTYRTGARYSQEDVKRVLTVYSLGRIESRSDFDYSGLKGLLEPADFCLACLDSYEEAQVKQLKAAGISAFCVAQSTGDQAGDIVPLNTWRVMTAKKMKVGMIHFDSGSDRTMLFAMIREACKAADYTIVCIAYDQLTEDVEELIRKAAKRCHQAIGVSSSEQQPLGLYGKTKKALYSIGTFVQREYDEEAQKDCAIIKHIVKKHGDKMVSLERSFIPCVFDGSRNTVRKIDVDASADLKTYRHLNNGIGNIVDEARILTVEKIFDIIHLPVPKELEALKSVTVNKICVYPNEIQKCSVLFIRDYDGVVHSDPEEEYYAKIAKKLRKNASKGLLFAVSPVDLPRDIPHIKVDCSFDLHRLVCKHIIDSCKFGIKVAVTGSTGKTSTKEMIALVLAEQYTTFKNNGNENLQTKMAMMLQELSPKYEAYVQEVGGGKIGGASSFSQMLTPDIGVVTNIGYSHLRWSKTREQLAINKVGIADGIRNNGPLFLNLDNDILQKTDVSGRNVITYAIDNKDAEYTAENIVQKDNKVLFDIVHDGHRTSCVVNTPGQYNIYNALVAYGIGQYAGIPEEKISAGIAKFKPEGIRQTLMQVGGYNLFVDCYNAAPNSMVGSVETLSKMGGEGSKKIAVLADMTGMEELSADLHKEVGRSISGCDIDYLICYGEDIRNTYESFQNEKVEKFLCTTKEEVVEILTRIMQPSDYISFKGSSKFKLEEDVIDAVFGTNLSTLAHDRSKKKVTKLKNATYQMFPGCAHVASGKGYARMELASEVKGKNVISISRGAFEGRENLEYVELPMQLRNIQPDAFKNCVSLTEVTLPEETRVIEQTVFENCTALTSVQVNEKLMHIGEGAFKNCTSLKEIRLPETVSFIGDGAFDGCADLTILCRENSYAAAYAQKNNIKAEYCQ